jgi:hypothetical protein
MADLTQPAIPPGQQQPQNMQGNIGGIPQNQAGNRGGTIGGAQPGQVGTGPGTEGNQAVRQGQGNGNGALDAMVMIMPATVTEPRALRHRTFTSYYSDPTCDPLWGNLTSVLGRFDPMRLQGPVSADELRASISGDALRPSCFLCCTALHNIPKIYVVHMLSRYPRAIDGRVTPWDNRIFAYLGDVVQSTPVNVLLPDDIFTFLAPTPVYNEETLA